MGGVTDRQLQGAEQCGRKMLATEPRAAAAHYDRAVGRVVVDLVNGCSYAFPARLVQDLHEASAEHLARVEVDGVGFNLHWPTLDVDLYVPALLAGIFGTQSWMAQEESQTSPRADTASASATEPAAGARGGRSRRIARVWSRPERAIGVPYNYLGLCPTDMAEPSYYPLHAVSA